MATSRGSVDTPALDETDRCMLLDLAEVALRAYLRGVRYPAVDERRLSPALLRPCHAFVVIRLGRGVFGCAGNLTDPRPLAHCVPDLTVHSAFELRDDRQLTADDLDRIEIEISVVEGRQRVPAGSRSELLRRIGDRSCGLAVTSGSKHAVLLPSAWRRFEDPGDYVDALLERAGLSADEWPDDLVVERLSTTEFSRLLD